ETRWEGQWTSDKHHKSDGSKEGGRLRCVLEPVPGDKLVAHFHANWKIFASNYSTTLEPVPGVPRNCKSLEYRGTQALPKLFGGVYHYDATIAGDSFVAKYTSSYDHGLFTLRRVPSPLKHFEMHPEH